MEAAKRVRVSAEIARSPPAATSPTSTDGDWRKVFSGNSTYKDNFAAGTAFLAPGSPEPGTIEPIRTAGASSPLSGF